MVFGVANLIAYCSRFMTLAPGDSLLAATVAVDVSEMLPPVALPCPTPLPVQNAKLGDVSMTMPVTMAVRTITVDSTGRVISCAPIR